jgi:hypothetical protein
MDIYSIFNLFICPESGLIILAIISLMEIVIKPIISKFSFRESNWFKKTALPLIVLLLTVAGAFLVHPVAITGIGSVVLYGLGLGLISNFTYRTGLSTILKKIGLEESVKNSIYPPKQ